MQVAVDPQAVVRESENLLCRVMRYQHSALVQRVQEKLELTREEAHAVFEDMKRFLHMCGTCSERFAPSEPIDACWHEFLLYTEDYARFCQDFFGHFIHHRPRLPDEPKGDGSIVRRTLEHAWRIFGNDLSPNWSYPESLLAEPKCGDCTRCSGSTNCQN